MSDRSVVASTGMILIAGSLLWMVAIVLEYRYDLFPPGTGALFVVDQVMFLAAMSAWIVGIFGLLVSGAAGRGAFGRISVSLFGLGWIVLVIAGVLGLATGDAELLLFPIGGLLATLGSLLSGIAVAIAGRWRGWMRYSVLAYALYYFLALWLPTAVTNRPPVFVTELLWGFAWLPMGFALLRSGAEPSPSAAAAQVERVSVRQ